MPADDNSADWPTFAAPSVGRCTPPLGRTKLAIEGAIEAVPDLESIAPPGVGLVVDRDRVVAATQANYHITI